MINHNGTDYIVRKNIMGDVTHLYTTEGKMVGKYVYDAWGNPLRFCTSERVSQLNPILYRGYCYDPETRLYYLKTRYYDPEACRFISSDDENILLLTADHANGIMSYTYCANNPVMDTDSDGQMPNWLKILLGIVIMVGAVVVSIVSVGVLTPLLAPLGAVVGGGLLGAVVVGAVAGSVGGAIASFGVSLGMQGISNGFDDVNWSQVGKDTLVGAFSGFVAGGIFGGIKYVASAAKIANSLSGLSEAAKYADDAALALKITPLIEKGGSMAMHEVAYNISKIAVESLNHARKIFNVLNFLVPKIYSLGNFGLKQLIGLGIRGVSQ